MSLPFSPPVSVPLSATDEILRLIYDGAKTGLRGDSLALSAGMLPVDYRRLRELDPLVEFAELKGLADGELEMSGVLHEAARKGDSKAALDILRYAHGWVAKQAVDISIDQKISIVAALEEAKQRVLNVPSVVLEDIVSEGGDDAV